MKAREAIVENYIAGYNQMDIPRMIKDLDESVVFKNVSNDEVDLEINGLESFKQQAEEAVSLFLEREQTITAIRHQNGAVEADLSYRAVLAKDFSDDLKKGQEVHLTGTSVFTFNKDNKITSLTDIS
jgi:hypothetical protein